LLATADCLAGLTHRTLFEIEMSMNIPHRPKSTASRALGRLLGTALFVWSASAVYTSAVAATAAVVPVDQAPLTVQKPLPPNIVLMLDDSGSMDSDYMPDWGYIDHSSNDALRNSKNNGTYYNPDVLYTPPATADGGSYPASPGLGNAFSDGFPSPGEAG
jgi:type IV pilus assembly protein PilY1